MKLLYYILFGMIISGMMPRCDNIEGSQKALWTSHSFTRDQPTNDIQIDNGKVIRGVQSWKRVWLGCPFKSITIDWSCNKKHAIQARVETIFLAINIAIGFILGLIFGIDIFFIRKVGKG